MKKTEWDKEETLLAWREAWAKHANRAWNRRTKPIDHRSYKDRHYQGTQTKHSRNGIWQKNRRHQGGRMW